MNKLSAKVQVRREKIKRLLVMGIPNTTIMKELQLKDATFYHDISMIKSEVLALLKKEPIENLLYEYSIMTDTVAKELWKTYHEVTNDNVKVIALNSIVKVMHEKIKILQSLGIIRQMPTKIELEGAIRKVVTAEDFQKAYDSIYVSETIVTDKKKNTTDCVVVEEEHKE